MKINKASFGYKNEELIGAFGFKGSALTYLCQVAVKIETQENFGIGLGVQSPLWSDAKIFSHLGEDESNKKMLELTKFAVEQIEGKNFDTPFDLFDMIYPLTYEFSENIIKSPDLRKTFVLNSLVAIDMAAWQLWVKENNKKSFDDISAFDSQKQKALANIPLITYGMNIDTVKNIALDGTPVFKIKIGSDPDGDGNYESMLEWDKKRLKEIHDVLSKIKTPYTTNGNILYYLDANGRYDKKERLMELLKFAEENEIADNIILIEEPFDENNKIYIGDIPYCFAADESAHSLLDVEERFNLGYRALTLKPIAKTLSLTIRMADYARKNGMKCFCADLTVNPLMVTWNQCVAARLNMLDKMLVGVVESNGKQNYVNWEKMQGYHPMKDKEFLSNVNGIYHLDDEFYKCDGGIFEISRYYDELSSLGGKCDE